MLEINQIKSEHQEMGQTSYWGESWATCSQREDDFQRRQKKMQARYEKVMEDGELSGMDAGWVALKAVSVASTLSKAAKNGCEWVTNKSINASFMYPILADSLKKNNCLDA